MKTRYAFLSLFLAASLLLVGCFEEVSGPYDGPDRVAFSQTGPTGTFATTVPDGAGTISVPTQLIGPQRSESFTVNVGVQQDTAKRVREVPVGDGTFEEEVDIRALPTTADSDNYNVPSSYEFPADSSNVPLQVEILDGLSSGDSPVRLTLRLDGNEAADIETAENWRYFEITIQP